MNGKKDTSSYVCESAAAIINDVPLNAVASSLQKITARGCKTAHVSENSYDDYVSHELEKTARRISKPGTKFYTHEQAFGEIKRKMNERRRAIGKAL